jgi:RNA polymerase sigma-70 factor (ECF subfamily)
MRDYFLRRLPVGEVNDAMAELFLVAWRRIDVAPEGDESRLWLYGVARNVVRNTERSMRRRFRLDWKLLSRPSTTAPAPETLVVERSRDSEVVRALASLRPDDQEILRLSVWEELSNNEIADVLGIDPHAATMRLSRARNRLAGKLGLPGTQPSRRRPVPDPSTEEVNS